MLHPKFVSSPATKVPEDLGFGNCVASEKSLHPMDPWFLFLFFVFFCKIRGWTRLVGSELFFFPIFKRVLHQHPACQGINAGARLGLKLWPGPASLGSPGHSASQFPGRLPGGQIQRPQSPSHVLGSPAQEDSVSQLYSLGKKHFVLRDKGSSGWGTFSLLQQNTRAGSVGHSQTLAYSGIPWGPG